MKKILKTSLYIIVSILVGVTAVYAGTSTFNPPPGAPIKTMKSLHDLYQLVDTGANSIPTTVLSAPSPVEPTMNSISDIYTLLNGKITSAVNVTGNNGDKVITIPDGFYFGSKTTSANDTNLIASNIKSGTSIFGITGSLIPTEISGLPYNIANLTPGNVRNLIIYGNGEVGTLSVGYTYGSEDATKVLTTAVGTPGTYDASNLTDDKVLTGTSYGVSHTGSLIKALGDATAGNVLTGTTFSNATTSNISGTMANNSSPTATIITDGGTAVIPVGYNPGGTITASYTNFAANAIKSGTTVGGTLGSYDTEATNPITAGTVLTGKVGFVNGSKITGTLASSLPAPLLATGQTGCWNAAGTVITCAGTGQDGAYLKGVTKSYTVSGTTPNNIVTDNNTGLQWKQCSEGLSGNTCATGTATIATWSNALLACEADTTGGFTDWRLPNLFELMSIVNLQVFSPAIDTTTFPATQSSYYWSSSTYAGSPTYAWYVYFNSGGTYYNSKTSTYNVRCVR